MKAVFKLPQINPRHLRSRSANTLVSRLRAPALLSALTVFALSETIALGAEQNNAARHPDDPIVTAPYSFSAKKVGDLELRIGNGAGVRMKMPLVDQPDLKLQSGFNTTPRTHLGSTWVINPQNELQFSTGAVLEF
jgi:hypothetical protein